MSHLKRTFTCIGLFVFALILTACGGGGDNSGGDNSGGNSGGDAQSASTTTTTITIEGDLQGTMNANTQQATIENNGFEDIVQLYFNENAEQVVTLMLPVDIVTGEYPIGMNDVTATYVNNTGDSNSVFLSLNGVLNLTRENNTFSGTFTFQAEQAELTEGQPQQVTVTGSFSDVALQNTGS